MSYRRFATMIATSTFVMFALMYFNTYSLPHARFSETRLAMALMMGAAMSMVMLGFMFRMYKDKRINVVILGVSVAVFGVSLWLVRSQASVGDVAYMRAMIPHHSIAILTSERAHIRDPHVRRLADGIIESQVREIREMERHIERLKARPAAASAPDLLSYRERGDQPQPQTDANPAIATRHIQR